MCSSRSLGAMPGNPPIEPYGSTDCSSCSNCSAASIVKLATIVCRRCQRWRDRCLDLQGSLTENHNINKLPPRDSAVSCDSHERLIAAASIRRCRRCRTANRPALRPKEMRGIAETWSAESVGPSLYWRRRRRLKGVLGERCSAETGIRRDSEGYDFVCAKSGKTCFTCSFLKKKTFFTTA